MDISSGRSENLTHPPVVLLVEDDESNRDMYSAYLEMAGYWVLGARNGAEGLIDARTYRPEVVVTDVSMPVMDGWELARALREDKSTSHMGIIALSGRPAGETKRHAAGVDVVLTKPCLPDELLKVIEELRARGHAAREHAVEEVRRAVRLQARSSELIETSKKHHRRRK